MADERLIARAREVYGIVCEALDAIKCPYQKNDKELYVQCTAQGEDIPMDATIRVDVENELILFFSLLQTEFPPEKIINAAVAVNAVNVNVVDGNFDLDVNNGNIMFRLACSYNGRQITTDLVRYIVLCSFGTVDAVNDKLDQLVKDEIELETFVSEFGY